jgi:hypothetical protein
MAAGRTFGAWRRLTAGAVLTGALVLVAGRSAGADQCVTLFGCAPPGATTPAPQAPPVTTTTTPPQPSSADAQTRLLSLVNSERTQRGLAALLARTDVAAIASQWSESMGRTATLAHNDAYFTEVSHDRLGAQLLGENVARAPDVDVAHGALMASDHHRANILDVRFTVIGIGATLVDGTWWITEDFLQPRVAGSGRPAAHAVPRHSRSMPTPAVAAPDQMTSTSTTAAAPTPMPSVDAAVAAPAQIVEVLPRVDHVVIGDRLNGSDASRSRRELAVMATALLLVLAASLARELRLR